MSRSSINMGGLRYFHEVAKAGSFRGAAERMHIAASAINRQIRILEDEIGVPLFERGRGRAGVTLTAAGDVLMANTLEAMSAMEQAKTEIAALQGLRGGHVKVGINEGFARLFFPQLLAEFHQAHPLVAFTVIVESSLKLVDLLLTNELEVVLAYNPPVRVGIEVIAQTNVDSYVMMHKSHPLANLQEIEINQLGTNNILLPSESLGARRYLDQMFAKAQFKPHSIMETNSYTLLQSAVAQNIGVAILSSYMLKGFSLSSNVTFVRVKQGQSAKEVLVCCVRSGRRLSFAGQLIASQFKSLLHPESDVGLAP